MDFWGGEDEAIITVIIFFMFLRLRRRNQRLILPQIQHTFNFDFYNLPEELFPHYMRFDLIFEVDIEIYILNYYMVDLPAMK